MEAEQKIDGNTILEQAELMVETINGMDTPMTNEAIVSDIVIIDLPAEQIPSVFAEDREKILNLLPEEKNASFKL